MSLGLTKFWDESCGANEWMVSFLLLRDQSESGVKIIRANELKKAV